MKTDIYKPAAQAVTPKQNDVPISFDPQTLRQARIQCSLTVEEAARLASVNKMTLLRYENGDIHTISPERLDRLARLYKVPPSSLAGIASGQEFFSEQGRLLLSPDKAETPSRLGGRLLACLQFFSQKSQDAYLPG